MAKAKETVTIEIAGARYRLTTDSDREHLELLASMVNDRIDALGPAARRAASPAQLLAVVALSLAEDLHEAERRSESLRDRTEGMIRQVIGRIDERLAEGVRAEEGP